MIFLIAKVLDDEITIECIFLPAIYKEKHLNIGMLLQYLADHYLYKLKFFLMLLVN